MDDGFAAANCELPSTAVLDAEHVERSGGAPGERLRLPMTSILLAALTSSPARSNSGRLLRLNQTAG